jgi:hypothetical protein
MTPTIGAGSNASGFADLDRGVIGDDDNENERDLLPS